MNAINTYPEYAFYYPGHHWVNTGKIKSMLPFFDGIALLIPTYLKHGSSAEESLILDALRNEDLLQILEPETIVDKIVTEKLVSALTDIIVSGKLDTLDNNNPMFHSISASRMGFYGDAGLAHMVLEELKARNLAKDSEDGYSVPIHPKVRILILVLLAQILRPYGKEIGIELSPVTDRPDLVTALKDIVLLSNSITREQVIQSDLDYIGVDFSNVPIDEVLDFRKQNRSRYRAYIRNIRELVITTINLPQEEREVLLRLRREEIEEQSQELKRLINIDWRALVSVGIAIAGCAWTYHSGDPVASVIGIAQLLAEAAIPDSQEVGTYSYLLKMQKQFH